MLGERLLRVFKIFLLAFDFSINKCKKAALRENEQKLLGFCQCCWDIL